METAVALSPIFFPEDSTYIDFELAGLLAHLAFCGLPAATNRNSGRDYKKFYKGLQLRVQLRYYTGFPFLTHFRNRKLVNQIAAKVENIPGETVCYPLIISRIMGFNPLKKNSTAITMTINPIRRIITLMPVCPSIFRMRDEL